MSAETRRSAPAWLAVVVGVLAAALVAAGIVFLVRSSGGDDGPATDNKAFVDRAATSQVIGQVSTGLQEVLSYSYADPKAAQASAKKWLTGDAPKQYDILYKQLQTLSAGQNLSFVARVSSAGVISLKANSATLLAFVDQQSTRKDGKNSVSAGQVQVGATKIDGTWRISNLQTL